MVPPPERWPRKFLPAEHGGDFGDGFFFHCAGGAAAVERVIVGIDEHRERVGEARDRMRGLQHLAGVERVEIGVVVVEAVGGGVEDFREAVGAGSFWIERRADWRSRRRVFWRRR